MKVYKKYKALKVLSETEIEILDSIIMKFGCYSVKILEKMTHIENFLVERREGGDEKTKALIES